MPAQVKKGGDDQSLHQCDYGLMDTLYDKEDEHG
jgi:hypothetical protein